MPNQNNQFASQLTNQLGALRGALQGIPSMQGMPQVAPQAPQFSAGQFNPLSPQFGQTVRQLVGQPMVPNHPVMPRQMVPLPQPKTMAPQSMGIPAMPRLNDNNS